MGISKLEWEMNVKRLTQQVLLQPTAKQNTADQGERYLGPAAQADPNSGRSELRTILNLKIQSGPIAVYKP